MDRPPPVYRPALALFAALGSAWVFVLVTLGAFTTTLGAGMAFPDWPLSNGSLSPHGWLDDVFLFAEHSHRLSGTTMGVLTVVLAVWLWRVEERAWLRRLGLAAVAIVVVQGLLGGTRVLWDAVHVPGVTMTLGQLLRIPHGVLAQVFVCVLFAIAAGLSRAWTERPDVAAAPRGVRRAGLVCVALLFVQLTVAAVMRHDYAGMAIPTFPFSTADGRLLPRAWDHRVALQLAHRAMALVLAFAIVGYAVVLWRAEALPARLRKAGLLLVALLAAQVALGAAVVWSVRDVYVTTAHVLVGALTLASVFLVTMFVHRGSVEARVGRAVGDGAVEARGPLPVVNPRGVHASTVPTR